MDEEFRRYIDQNGLLSPGERVVAGVSGGVDSVVLLHLLYTNGYPVVVAHVNHGLREGADRDEAFVEDLSDSLGFPIRTIRPDIKQRVDNTGQSIQQAARKVRYRFFGRVARETEIRTVCVGHNRDDQVETILMHLFRGTGLRGLAGMRPRRPLDKSGEASPIYLARPLLFAWREAIQDYASEQDLEWCTDPTNQSPKYDRSRLRHQIIPIITDAFGPAVRDNVARTGRLVREYLDSTIQTDIEELWQEAVIREGTSWFVRLEPLTEYPGVLQRHLILELLARAFGDVTRSEAVASQIRELIDGQVGRRIELDQCTIWRERSQLVFSPSSSHEVAEQVNEVPDSYRLAPDTTVPLAGDARITAEMNSSLSVSDVAGDPRRALVDGDDLEWPLRIRRWAAGDELQPLGMEGHKKVSDFLTDSKIPTRHRRRVWVVLSGEQIIWVVGYRIADPVRITEQTNQQVLLTYEGFLPPREPADRPDPTPSSNSPSA